jgi:NADPH:quinone reductase-like Zn-dependent oxidoreductase
MKAIVQDEYGSPGEVLELREVDRPEPGKGEVLIRARAAAVNIGDWHLMRGIPYAVRTAAGLRRPRHAVPGTNVAGEVEAVGEGVEALEPGDEVFGWCHGAFAEYACADEDHFLPKPAGLDFEQAAAVGDSATTALNAVRDQAKVEPGQKVLVNGASGGVGTFAVQIARALGAGVTAVCSGRNAEMVGSIGADRVIDYTKEDFTEGGERYDALIDMVGGHSLAACRRVLTRRGTYVLVGKSDPGRWLGLSGLVKTLGSSPFTRRRMRAFVSIQNRDDLTTVKEMVEAGKITPVIDRVFRLDEVAEALTYQGEGHARGKSVISIQATPLAPSLE